VNESRIVAVSGATAGIGLGVARQFAAAGHRVLGSARGVERGRTVEAELRAAGLDFTFVPADVSTTAGSQALIDAAVATHGGLDVLVNNAGTVGTRPLAPFMDVTEQHFDELVATNLRSMFFTTQLAAKAMADLGGRGGTVFNLGSLAGETVAAEMLTYRTTKAAAMFMSECLADALRPAGITVHTIVVHRVVSEGGRRTLEQRIVDIGADEAEAERLRRDYAATATEPDDLGRRLVHMLDHPGVTIGPGFTVRR